MACKSGKSKSIGAQRSSKKKGRDKRRGPGFREEKPEGLAV
jgi:hypothetical protein